MSELLQFKMREVGVPNHEALSEGLNVRRCWCHNAGEHMVFPGLQQRFCVAAPALSGNPRNTCPAKKSDPSHGRVH